MYVYVYVYDACRYADMYTHTHTYTYAYMCCRPQVRVSKSDALKERACRYVDMYTHTHTHTYINTYIPTGEGEQELRAEGAAAGPGLPLGR